MATWGGEHLGDEKGHSMEIAPEHKDAMEDIIVNMATDPVKCRKDFQCYKSSLEDLCKVKAVGAFDTIQCLAKDAQSCGFSFGAIGDRYCRCPLRRYIAEYLHQ